MHVSCLELLKRPYDEGRGLTPNEGGIPVAVPSPLVGISQPAGFTTLPVTGNDDGRWLVNFDAL